MFQFNLPHDLIISIQKYLRLTVPYCDLTPRDAFCMFIQDLVIRFIATFQPTEILLNTLCGKNMNYVAYNLKLLDTELKKVIAEVGRGRYFEEEIKKRLFLTWKANEKMVEIGLDSSLIA